MPSEKRSVTAAMVDEQLTDPEFLVNTDPGEVVALLDKASTPAARVAAEVYRASAHLHQQASPGTRRQLLTVDAGLLRRTGAGDTGRSVPVEGQPGEEWAVEWATGSRFEPRLLRSAARPASMLDPVAAVVVDGRPHVLIHTSQAVRMWDLTTGEQAGQPITSGDAEVFKNVDAFEVVAAVVVNNRPHAVTHDSRRVRVWDLTTGEQVGATITTSGKGRTVAAVLINDRPHAVIGDIRGTVRIWDLTTGEQAGEPMTGHNGDEVTAVAAVEADGRLVIVSVGCSTWTRDGVTPGAMRVWDPAATWLAGERLTGHGADVWAAATAVADGRPVVLSGGKDREVRIRDMDTGLPVGPPLDARTDVRAVATTMLNGHLHAVVGTGFPHVLVWNLATGWEMDGPQGHVGPVRGVATTVVNGRTVAITGDAEEAAVSVWDLAKEELVGWLPPASGGTSAPLAAATVSGRPCAVIGIGPNVQLWDLATLQQTGQNLTGHTGKVWAVTTAVIGGRPYAATGDDDGMVLVWDLTAMEQVGNPLTSDSHDVIPLLLTEMDGRPHAVIGGSTGKVQVWDPVSGEQSMREWCFPGPVGAMAFGQDGRLVVGFGQDVAVLSRR